MDVNNDSVAAAFRAANCTLMIHGHTHRPACHQVEVAGRRCQRWVLDAWYEDGSYLLYEDGRLRSMRLT